MLCNNHVHLFKAQKTHLLPYEIHAIWSILEQHKYTCEKLKIFKALEENEIGCKLKSIR